MVNITILSKSENSFDEKKNFSHEFIDCESAIVSVNDGPKKRSKCTKCLITFSVSCVFK